MIHVKNLYKDRYGNIIYNLCVNVFDKFNHKLFTCIVPWIINSSIWPFPLDEYIRETGHLWRACSDHNINYYDVIENKRFKIINENDAIETRDWFLFKRNKS